MIRRQLATAAISLVVMAAAGCTSSSAGSGTSQSTAKPVITIGLETSVSNLNPALTIGAAQIYDLAYASITHLNPDGTVSPGLATSWHYIGAGNLDFEFTLRKDAKFSDGTPVTSAAVKTYLQYWSQAKGPFASDIAIKSIATTGNWTVDLHLKTPNPILPYLLTEVFGIGFVSSPQPCSTRRA